ncbi:hypothetical protein TRIUR3_20035 [Triticum urartu]|uniref:C3H1-type domain-containing protein n=1 Tax=Triticum urartu TaxID=4572 RepID=M7YD42_TRIUA|nr:hypothetical protein TRIUR3_20035 [Triticum urartu]
MDGDGSLRFDFEDDVDASSAGSGSASSEAPILAVGGPSRGRGHGSIEMDGDEDSLRFDFEDGLDAAGAGTESSAWPFEAPIPSAGGPSHGPGSRSIQMDGDEAATGPASASTSRTTSTPSPLDPAPTRRSRSAESNPQRIPYPIRILLQYVLDMFSVGFCLNGSNCKCMHVKLPGSPPVQEVLQKFQQTNAYNYGSSSTTYQPRDNNCKQKAKPQVQHESVLKNQNLAVNATLVPQQPAAQHVQTANPPPHLQQQQNAQVQGVHNGSSIQKLPQLQAHFHKGNQGGSF